MPVVAAVPEPHAVEADRVRAGVLQPERPTVTRDRRTVGAHDDRDQPVGEAGGVQFGYAAAAVGLSERRRLEADLAFDGDEPRRQVAGGGVVVFALEPVEPGVEFIEVSSERLADDVLERVELAAVHVLAG